MMRILLLLAFLLTACAPSQTAMPTSIVMLTDIWPNVERRCTGVALDSRHILTANHCADLDRVVTQYGQEALLQPTQRWSTVDIALVETSIPLLVGDYARLATPNTLQPAAAFGACPAFFSHVPRWANYRRDMMYADGSMCQMWFVPGAICGGDSGGVLMQDGAVVGVIVAVNTYYFWYVYGQEACVVPTHMIEQVLKAQE